MSTRLIVNLLSGPLGALAVMEREEQHTSEEHGLESFEQSLVLPANTPIEEICVLDLLNKSEDAMSEAKLDSDDDVPTLDSGIFQELEEYVDALLTTIPPEECCRMRTIQAVKTAAYVSSSMPASTNKHKKRRVDFVSAEGMQNKCATASDPLTQFVVILSSVIGSLGMPSATEETADVLNQESRLDNVYGNECVANQHAFETAWSILMEDGFDRLRRTIFSTPGELIRFRALLMRAVLAFDTEEQQAAVAKSRLERQVSLQFLLGKERDRRPKRPIFPRLA